MLTAPIAPIQTATWQTELAQAITDPGELLALLQLEPKQLAAAYQACLTFPCRVPRGFVARMRKGDPRDPLLLQVLPQGQELIAAPGYVQDPLEEQAAIAIPGLLHKYHGRVLLTLTGACAINCRYCFRRHFPYSDNNPNVEQWSAALNYIANDATITEVILSGGDPLVIKDSMLELLINKLEKIPHLKRLRFHSRLPIVLPQRLTPELLEILTNTRLAVIMVTHSNHANEIDAAVTQAILGLRENKIPVLNQAVLLKDINDNAEALIQLSEKLLAIGVLPYYLHLLDPVQGAAHFDVNQIKAKELIKIMQEKLPGYLIPKLVRENSKAKFKTLII